MYVSCISINIKILWIDEIHERKIEITIFNHIMFQNGIKKYNEGKSKSK